MKVRMTVSLDEQLVDKLSEVAKRNGLSNSGVLNLCLRYALPRLESGHLLDTSRQEPRPLSVLLVEDMELDAQLVIQTLRRGDYEPKFEVVQTEKEMSTALQKGGWVPIPCCTCGAGLVHHGGRVRQFHAAGAVCNWQGLFRINSRAPGRHVRLDHCG